MAGCVPTDWISRQAQFRSSATNVGEFVHEQAAPWGAGVARSPGRRRGHALRGIFARNFPQPIPKRIKTGTVPISIRASVTPTTEWASCAPKRDV